MALELSLDGGTPVLVASKDPVPYVVQSLTLNVSEVNVADIMLHRNIQVIAKLATDQVVPNTMHHTMDLADKVVYRTRRPNSYVARAGLPVQILHAVTARPNMQQAVAAVRWKATGAYTASLHTTARGPRRDRRAPRVGATFGSDSRPA